MSKRLVAGLACAGLVGLAGIWKTGEAVADRYLRRPNYTEWGLVHNSAVGRSSFEDIRVGDNIKRVFIDDSDERIAFEESVVTKKESGKMVFDTKRVHVIYPEGSIFFPEWWGFTYTGESKFPSPLFGEQYKGIRVEMIQEDMPKRRSVEI